ncbi:sulfatase-like hydrolase/transferase [Neolewinella aurantiaca]|uniref:Sulfatase-like hydrolase/transferase n=1 Tax=Neolewinella aurantiaca TaxID=2602767 RepID=A0A5C7F3L6_9BACT|nr:sulfatase-like hydrolase/transferase [Neolewinella aurantiaca]TXF83900.1 sulfatase-like hydrolase/transferase [Neolewinella aurantiaca]
MLKSNLLRTATCLALLPFLCTCGPAQNSTEANEPTGQKTNIVFILADDFGITDAQGYAARFTNSKPTETFYETPNLNRLMAEGVSFSQAYATQLCSPTRAGILSGKYAPRLGFMTAMPLRETYYNQALPVPEGYYAHDVLDHRDNIETERAWDNGTSNSALPANAPEDEGRDILSLAEALPDHQSAFIGKWHIGGFGAAGHQPADQGFEPLAWFDAGGSAYYNWRRGWNNKSKTRYPEIPQSEWAIGDAGDSTGQNYLTDDLTQQAINYLEERAADKNGKPFFLYFSHFAVHSPYQGIKEETEYFSGKANRGNNGHNDPVYASMLKGLDRSVGAIMDQLKRSGLDQNTTIIFMSDNGGIDRKITPKGDGTDNAPFLGGKACLTEGGIRVPLIIRAAGQTNSGWIEQAVDYTDIYPTIVAAAGYNARRIIEQEDLDGQSLLPLVTNTHDGTYDKNERYWHYPFNVIYNSPYDGYALTPHSAVRIGDDKLIFDWHGRLHLYDIAKDPYEKNDLATADPELTEALFAKLMNWLEENVDRRYWPVLNPDYKPELEVREVPFQNLVK